MTILHHFFLDTLSEPPHANIAQNTADEKYKTEAAGTRNIVQYQPSDLYVALICLFL